MEKRKNPEKDLYNKSVLFFQIGLLIAMGMVVSAFEFKAEQEFEPIAERDIFLMEDPIIVPISIVTPPPPPPKPILARPVEVKDDPLEEIPPETTFEIEEMTEIPEPEPVEEPKDEIQEFWDYVDEAPMPIGGYEAFYKFLSKNVKYPKEAVRHAVEGKVYVRFIVDSEGNITQIETIKSVGSGLDEEAMRVIGKAPAWKPGRQGGKRVSVRMVIPIIFEMPR